MRSFEELAALTDDGLGALIDDRAQDPRAIRDLFAEQSRRIARGQRDALEAEKKWFEDTDAMAKKARELAVERAYDRAAEFMKKHGDTASMEAAGLMSCPKCGALAGSKCRGADGQTMDRRVHPGRVNAARGFRYAHGRR